MPKENYGICKENISDQLGRHHNSNWIGGGPFYFPNRLYRSVRNGCAIMDGFGSRSGFYYWKSKNENRIKLTKSMVKDWADTYGIEAVATLAEIVLKGD